MFRFIWELLRSLINSLLVATVLFIATYCLITHQFPPNFTKMRKAWDRLGELTSFEAESSAKTGAQAPAQIQQIVESVMKGPEDVAKLQKEVRELRDRVESLEKQQNSNPGHR